MSTKAISLPKSVAKLDFQEILNDFRFMNPNDPGAWPVIPKATVLLGLFLVIMVAD